MKDVLFGYGTVGKATAKAFGIEHCFDWWDERYVVASHSDSPYPWATDCLSEEVLVPLSNAHWIWVCVPTPSLEKGDAHEVPDSCDTSIVEKVVRDFAHLKKPFVIRSTVIPGTARRLMDKYGVEIVSFPEFGSEATMERDIKFPWLCVTGANFTLLDRFRNDHRSHFSEVDDLRDIDSGYASCQISFEINEQAEMVKYAMNALFATLVVFGNQIYDACECDWLYEAVRTALKMLPWKDQHHLDVMDKGYRGYAGKCLPKDVRAMIAAYDLPLLKEVERINAELVTGHLAQKAGFTMADVEKWDRLMDPKYSLPLFEGVM